MRLTVVILAALLGAVMVTKDANAGMFGTTFPMVKVPKGLNLKNLKRPRPPVVEHRRPRPPVVEHRGPRRAPPVDHRSRPTPRPGPRR
jgi:hypothetical protein